MRRRAMAVLYCLGTLLLAGKAAQAQVLGTSARQMGQRSLKVLTYFQAAREADLNFALSTNDEACRAGPTNPNAVSFACGQQGDVGVEGNGGYGVLKLVYQPWETMQYYAAVGVGDYSVRIPSVTVNNHLTGDKPGTAFTLGAKAVIIADTVVSPAVAVDFSVTRARHLFNRRVPGGIPNINNNINQRLDMMHYALAVETSHLFTLVEKEKIELVALRGGVKLEPYGGVRWTRTVADLKDLVDGSHVGGSQDVVTPFLGLRLPMFEHEGLFAEASFVGGYHWGTGLEVRFE